VSTVIKLKRGTATPTTSDIVNGEVAIDTSAKKLYINDSGTVKEIGGGAGGGGASITIQDEGSSLSTAAETINFVVAGVTASGTGATKTITISGGSGGLAVTGTVRDYTGDGSTAAFTVTSGSDDDNVMVFLNGVYQRPTTDYSVSSTTLTFTTAPISGDVITIKEIIEESVSNVDLTSISTDLTPDTHNEYDIGQLGSAFRDVTFVRKLQKNVEIFTRAVGLGTVATNLGFNINTNVANMTQVFTAAGGLDTPVLSSDAAAFDDNNPAFLF
jgi:hypothetical protein